jgi:hypothetical protein
MGEWDLNFLLIMFMTSVRKGAEFAMIRSL